MKPSSQRDLQEDAMITLADDKKIEVEFTSATTCRASIEASAFVVRSCSSCSLTCPTNIVSFDCSNYFEPDPCSKVDCDGNCSNGEASPTILQLAPVAPPPPTSSPSASPLEAVEAPSGAPSGAPSASPAVEEAPSTSPVEEVEAPSGAPSGAPSASASPAVVEEAPSASPTVVEEAPSASPVEEEEAPSASPVVAASPMAATTPSLVGDSMEAPTGVPSVSPLSSLVPFVNETMAPECSMNSACDALGLTGDCCPTVAGWILDCCDNGPPVEKTCEMNPGCDALGLRGSCCPTLDLDFGYLDCWYVQELCLSHGSVCCFA